MLCDGLGRSCLINSVDSIHPLEEKALTRAQLLKSGRNVYRKSYRLHDDQRKHKSRKFHYAIQTLAPSPAGTSATQTRFDQSGHEFLVQNASLDHSSWREDARGILGICSSRGQRDIYLTEPFSAQRLQMTMSALMGIHNIDPWPMKEAPTTPPPSRSAAS